MAGIRLHGESYRRTRLHNIWRNLRQRCNNPNNKSYSSYGGRGIRVCPEWNEYVNFKKWAMENGYSDELSIDRIDVNGDYCPDNCRWADTKTQGNNRRTNRKLTLNGETHTVAEWSKIVDIQEETLRSRMHLGWTDEDILTKPTHQNEKVLEYNGEKHSVTEWGEILGIPRKILYSRLNDINWSVEKALSTPYSPRKFSKPRQSKESR